MSSPKPPWKKNNKKTITVAELDKELERLEKMWIERLDEWDESGLDQQHFRIYAEQRTIYIEKLEVLRYLLGRLGEA